MRRRRRARVKLDALLTVGVGLLFFSSKGLRLTPAATNTTLKTADVLAALRGAGVSESALALVAAHSAFETAGWVGCWNFNLGNITQPNLKEPHVYQPGNALPFATYANLGAGAQGFVQHLTRIGALAVAPDLDAYVDALKRSDYAGPLANYDDYKAGIVRWLSSLKVQT